MSAVPLRGCDRDTLADFTVHKGDRVSFVMSWAPSHESEMPHVNPEQALSVASLDATAAALARRALARRGAPLAGDDLMILHGGVRAALVSGPDGHRFLVQEERAAAATGAAPGFSQARKQGS
jgi:hypothetical protein